MKIFNFRRPLIIGTLLIIVYLCQATVGMAAAVQPKATANSSGEVKLNNRGSWWKYLDDGSDQGTAWHSVAFDDRGWKTGRAELGYGDGDEATVVGYGPDTQNKYTTTYFRKLFNVENKNSIKYLTLNVRRDDGVVVYLNGTEVARSNMPGGQIDYKTPAKDYNISETTFYPYSINPALLVNGKNILAVELHQCSGISSDISFNLDLAGSSKIITAKTNKQNVKSNTNLNKTTKQNKNSNPSANAEAIRRQIEFTNRVHQQGIDALTR